MQSGDILEVLMNIDIGAFGLAEWVQLLTDLNRGELIPRKSITRKSTPEEIIAHISEREEALRYYFGRVTDIIRAKTQRDLFKFLGQPMDVQIERLNNCKNPDSLRSLHR